MIVLKILGLLVFLLVIPTGLGLLFRMLPRKGQLPERLQTMGVTLLIGYIVMFVLLEMVGIPVMLISVYHGYSIMVVLYAVLLVGGAVVGYALWIRSRSNTTNSKLENTCSNGLQNNHTNSSQSDCYNESGKGLRKRQIGADRLQQQFHKEPYDTWEGRILLLLFLMMVGFQLYMAFTRASFDGDDAYYVVQALTAQQTDTLYRIDPNRGVSMPLDARHALALFPIWEAFIGTMCGIHATIVAHSVAPLILIPLTYLIYYEIGRELFVHKKRLLPMFMALMALWQMFGNVSIYTTETFFLTRTWQGKSFAGNFIIPAVFWLFLCLFRESEAEKNIAEENLIGKRQNQIVDQKNYNGSLWILLALLNLSAGAGSSLAVLLSCSLSVGLGVLLTIRTRRLRNFILSGCSCVLGGIYIILYMLL